MREIKFRGKDPNGEWRYGSLLCWPDGDTAICFSGENDMATELSKVPVEPATVGQFTGLTDKNGNEIYEGDIVKLLGKTLREVLFREGVFGYPASFPDEIIALGQNHHFKWKNEQSGIVEVIGNIHDSHELLKN